MNWLTNFIRPRIRQLVEPKEVPDNLWQKCPSCEGMLFHRDLEESHHVCYHCGHHLRLEVKQRLTLMFDDGKFEKMPLPRVAFDPLKFKDRKRYADRLKEAKTKTGLEEAITIAKGTIGRQNTVIAAFNFNFMGGSMGAGAGEAIVTAAKLAVQSKSAFIVIPASGGARMQEGMLSLLQMPRTIIGVEMVKEAGLPYIVLLTDPTTGGVSASFAMVGDIHIAEPGATIGFAGRRVIEETVREKLPTDFQTAEYLQEHGMVDLVVPRRDIHETLSRILGLLMEPRLSSKQRSGPFKSSPFKTSPRAGGQYFPDAEKPGNKAAAKAAKAARAALKQVKSAKSAKTAQPVKKTKTAG